MNRSRNSNRRSILRLRRIRRRSTIAALLALALGLPGAVNGEQSSGDSTAATIDGTEPGWHPLTENDFENVNCFPDTWTWKGNGVQCSGRPIGVIRSKRQYSNFELVARWKHLQTGGNSGVFVWASPAALADMKPDTLPNGGIEIQILDHDYSRQYEESSGEKATWFTTNGDIFPVGASKMKPFAPTSPGGERSFPRLNLSNGVGVWNTYYVRCINGEIRLWVNGTEVSGGNICEPSSGYLCLESEGAPLEFRDLKIRELP